MPEPFGKRNLRLVTKPLPTKKRSHNQTPQPKTNPKLYIYSAGAVLFVILASCALAQ